MKNYHSGH